MTLIDKTKLFKEDISCLDAVAEFITMENARKLSNITSDNKSKWFPPIFLFHEQRTLNQLHGQSLAITMLHGGHGSRQLTVHNSMSRDIIDFSFFGDNNTQLNDDRRGKILAAFCKLEFCIDALICLEMGVFDNKLAIKDMHKELKTDRDGLFTTANKKVNYLVHKNRISSETYESFKKAKNIRNSLAHQYLPIDEYGISKIDLKNYKTHLNAIDQIFNGCWYYLLKDYGTQQLPVIHWLDKQLGSSA